MQIIEKYLESEGGQFAVEQERYGGSYRAIVCHRSACDFIFDNLEGDDLDGTQMQSFFWDNALFPSATGNTVQEAVENLESKLKILYTFEKQSGVKNWLAVRNFELKAPYDCDGDEEQTFYDVSWLDIINDLKLVSSRYFYESAKEQASLTKRRDLHALIKFNYTGDFLSLN
jgi:hypothetical protein